MPTPLDAICSEVVTLRDDMARDLCDGVGMTPGEILKKVGEINAEIPQFDSLRAPYDDAPEISVVIPVFNQLRSTLSCIHSLVRHASKYSFEIVVVDFKVFRRYAWSPRSETQDSSTHVIRAHMSRAERR
jgi:hypothetical protein